MKTKTASVIAVSIDELNEFGCPYCGYRSGTMPISGGGSAPWVCGECEKRCCVLASGVTKSKIGFRNEFPELQPHPRRGIPSHGNPDVRPGAGGEFFRLRGIGLDVCKCFVCGTSDRNENDRSYVHNIAAFVRCKEAGERVVAMFDQGVRLDYREHEPDRVQVKIGACDEHLENLKKLEELTEDGVITKARIREAAGRQGVNLDELQAEAEKLVALLKEREQCGTMAWNMFMRERLTALYALISVALNK